MFIYTHVENINIVFSLFQGIDGKDGDPGPRGEKGDKVRLSMSLHSVSQKCCSCRCSCTHSAQGSSAAGPPGAASALLSVRTRADFPRAGLLVLCLQKQLHLSSRSTDTKPRALNEVTPRTNEAEGLACKQGCSALLCEAGTALALSSSSSCDVVLFNRASLG